MARGGQIARRRKTRNKVKLEKNGSDESDEDYMVSEDEIDDSDDEYCSSLADDETEESLGEFEEDEEAEEEEELEEGWVNENIKKVGRHRRRRNNGVVIPRKKKVAYGEEEREDSDDDEFSGAEPRKKRKLSHKEKEDDDISVLYRQEADNLCDEKPRKKTRVSSTEKYMAHCSEKSRKKSIVSYREEKEDGDSDNSDEDSDEEFTPDEVDGADDDEESPVTKKNKEVCLRVQQAQIANGKKRKRNVKALRKKNKRKKPIKDPVSRKNNRYHGKEFEDESPDVRRNRKITEKGRRKKSNANSDPDFVSSGLSDYEYTISEEEREQIREAGIFCSRLTTSLPTSSPLKMNEEEEILPSQRKRQEKKGKEKVVDMKIEVVKQVCGICLSEEGKRSVRGILNCCSHYFCFACIMEWSKVESRCPLCKQRFATISRTARADGRHDLKDAVIPIPQRDQVYQPSEEELRGYLYPYENVLCSECHHGGDDALMLLCDLCDSPAHTYCVGLGREVPEGSWFCDGCRPTALTSPNAQSLNPTPDHGADNNLSVGSSPVGTVRETFDLNELYVPDTPLTQVTAHSPSPRFSSGDLFPTSGLGAFTLFERRRIQRTIEQLLNYRRRRPERNDNVAAPVSASGISLFGSRISRDGVRAPQQQALPVQMAAPQSVYNQGRLPDYTRSLLYGREVLNPNLSSLRGQEFNHQESTSTGYSLGRHSELSGIGHQQLQPCNSRSNTGADASISSSYQFREVSLSSSLDKEQVQSMVKSHLTSLSRNMNLGYNNFKYIARTSTHTILAAIGLQHRWNEVYPVRTQPLMCNHSDRFASGQTNPVKGQCSSCFDWFVKNVVKEILFTGAPLSLAD